ncbi:MAG TPA: alpha/beta hydrolase [Thermoleophilaceae bacterium]|nr:alpha/beta hydrolase [Thermoleophilaceae bacterium]
MRKLSEQAAWRAQSLGPPRTLDLGAGRRMRAHVTGEGPAIVFVHGVLVNANLWRKLVPLLDGYTLVTLDLPLGSHVEPMVRSADLGPPALADLIADAVAALGLEDATIVGNDTGGALTQIVAVRRPERIGRLVLTSCDAFENFPPRFFRVVLAPARIPGGTWFHFRGLWLRPLRRLPVAYGWLTNAPVEPEADDSYVLPVLTSGGVRRDLRKVLGGLDPRHTSEAAARLATLDRPALIAWSEDDRFFPREHGERLAKLIPDARLEWVEGARTFSPEDRPERLAELIAGFVPR